MMRTRLWQSTLAALAVASVLVSCGASGEPDEQASVAPPPPVLGGDTTPEPDEPMHTLDFEDEPVDETLRDSTPYEAFATFVERLRAHDIFGAVEVCVPVSAEDGGGRRPCRRGRSGDRRSGSASGGHRGCHV
ncbi:MAG: hypothetical protein ACYTF7_00605 [Planctomycetota bacterium]